MKNKNPHAVALGKAKSEVKARASRENGKLGGRPRTPPPPTGTEEAVISTLKDISEDVDSFGIPLLEDMAAYREEDTGLPMIVVILSTAGAKHAPRIKIQQDYNSRLNKNNLVSVSISSNPEVMAGKWKLSSEDFDMVKSFIKKNKSALLDYWNYKLLTRELEDKLVRI